MTTRVTIDAHAGWDVEVTCFDPDEPEAIINSQIIPANTTAELYVWQERGLKITEMRK